MLVNRALHRVVGALTLICLGTATAVAVAVLPLGADADTALSLDPTSGISGAPVTITPGFLKQSPCTLELDGTLLQTFTCGPGVSVQLTVNGHPGPHTITVCAPSCDGNNPSESATYTILVLVPKLTGLTVSEARTALESLGLELGPAPSRGYVTSQNPLPDTQVQQKSEVSVTVRSGAEVHLVSVPDVRGYSLAQARRRLVAAGLIMSTTATAGTVVTQSVNPGVLVSRGSTVSVTTRPIVTIANTAPPTHTSLTAAYRGPAAVALFLLLLLLIAVLVVRHVRRSRRRKWMPEGPVPRVVTRVTSAGVTMHSLRHPPPPPVEFRTSRSSTLTIGRKP